ncbi:Fas3 family protein [Megaselia abdita]
MASVGLLRKSRIIQLLVILFGINLQANLINGQRVEVTPENVIVKEGGSTTISCRYGQKINFCLFHINGSDSISVNEKYDNNGVRYTGAGLANGECGITIDRVTSANNGQTKCTLGVDGHAGGLVEGLAQIVVARSAQPEIQIENTHRNGVFSTEIPLKAYCTVVGARPQANIQWFLNDQQITRSLSRQVDQETAPGEFSSRQDIEYRLTPEDDGKSLICKAVQFQDDNENRYAKQQLNIEYAPVPEQDFHVYGLDLGQTATINVTIRANPQPRVHWTVDGNSIAEGQRIQRYSANTPIPLGNGFYNVTFSIGGLTLEDTTKTYYLSASNLHGPREYTVKISSSDKPLTAQGLEVGAIVGIVIACAILILVVLLVVFARLTGRWCFSGKSVKSPTNETSDTESADIKSSVKKLKEKQRLPTFSAIFKNKKQSSDALCKGDGSGTHQGNDDEQRLADNTGDGSGTDGNDNKEDKQLVYAELVLKPSGNSPVAERTSQRPSTEYAEITYKTHEENADTTDETTNKSNNK